MRFGRFLKFGVVGGTGAGVNTAILYILSRGLGLPLLVSSATAVEMAIVSNYLLNNRWTFASHEPSFRRFVKFNTTSLGGFSLNIVTVWALTRSGLYLLAANLAGIALAVTVNYACSVAWVWRRSA